jgi:hypothetical protein
MFSHPPPSLTNSYSSLNNQATPTLEGEAQEAGGALADQARPALAGQVRQDKWSEGD